MRIDFEFATHDDCLDKMVPSDLRSLVAESDALLAALETVEWNAWVRGEPHCCGCSNHRDYGHRSNCVVGNTLKQVKGK